MSRAADAARPDLAGLSRQEKIALVQRLARQRSGREIRAPLSFAQYRMWFLDQLEPGNPFNNVCRAFLLRGRLDAAALAASLGEIVRRHGALSTRFPVVDGEPVQVVQAPAGSLSLPLADLSRLPAPRRRATAEKGLGRELRHGFDLARGPLFRALLLRLAGDEHVLVVNVHHIVFDGWSLGVLLRELALGYAAFHAGRAPELPAPAVQYADYARWQAKHLRGENLERLLAWWRQHLRDAPTTLELPADRPRPAVETYRGAVVTRRLPAARRLQALGRRSGATPFMTLLAAFATLMWRHSGQRDMVIGTPVANRRRAELEGIIGLFANTLALRLRLAPTSRFASLLEQVRRDSLAVFAHQDLPFERLVEDLQPQRDLSRNPLFQVMFAFHNLPPAGAGLPGLAVERFEAERVYAKVDLTLDAVLTEEGLGTFFELNTDLFDRATIDRLARHFEHLLEAVAAEPQRRLDELPLLSAAERQALVAEWNDTRRPAPASRLLHQLFEEQARRTPAAPALEAGGRVLSYRELDRLAGRLAAKLRRLGVRAEVPVGVFTGRSPEAVVALLGILKAGGAYVPLDPEAPRQRLAFFVADAGMPVVLAREALGRRLPEGAARVVAVDLGELAGGGDAATTEGEAGGAAYVIYTSGSTGVPKGVVVPHRAIVRHAAAIVERYRLGPGDRALQFTSPSFDVALEEMFPTWLAGGTVVLRPDDLSLVLEDFLAFVERQRLSVLNLPTPYWHEWAAALPGAPPPPPDLRLVVVGTERALPERVAAWRRHLGSRVGWINSYGVTEATVTSTAHGPAGGAEVHRVPVGRPLGHIRTYVLDGALRPAPAGVPGELHVGGGGVARGYLRRPRATAAAFVPDPVAARPGARLYATGDRARWQAGGELDLLGRGDDQIKLRGFRVELGEVEAALAELPAVRECAVLAREQPPASRRLVAYVVPEAGAALAVASLRGELAARLPEYMVPAAFVVRDQLPRTPGGKVDRRALPATELGRDGLATDYVAPRDGLEGLVAEVWAEVLGGGPVGVHDNFFALGGHSLLATQVISRLRRALELEVTLHSLFAAPTVAGLCRRLAAVERPPGPPEPPLAAAERGASLPLSFAQERLWFLDQLEPSKSVYNLASPLALAGELDAASLAAALHALGCRHETLRTTFVLADDRPVQRVHPRPAFGLPAVDLSALPAARRQETARRLAARESRRPFDLDRGPLVRTALVRLGRREHVLLLTLHHIVADGWSIDVVMHELAELYRAAREGRPARLASLPLQYADFALWQRQWLRGEVLAAQLAYWRERLAGAPAALDLPTDRPRPAVPSYRGRRRYLKLPAAATAALDALGRRRGATTFMTVLAAFDVLLRRYTGQTDVVVGTPIAGRHRPEIEGLIGLFVNTLVLRADLAGDPAFEALLDHVRETALGAYAHQDLPFEQLVDAVEAERDLSRNPVFQVFFAWQTMAPQTRAPRSRQGDGEEPAIGVLSLDSGAAQFDLSLTLWRSPEAGLEGFLTYATDLFDATTMARAARHLERLLAVVAAAPGQAISALPLMAASERHQLLREINDTDVEVPAASLVLRAFAAQAAARPAKVAVAGAGGELTYGELAARSDQLGRHLCAAGVGADARVGIFLERSPQTAVALLGVLKAGGAYVPIDPDYPRDRIALMLEDSGAVLVVTQAALGERLPAGVRTFLLDRELVAGGAAEPLPPLAEPASLAYVIYTSGSTGRPKGVAIPHRALANFLDSMRRRPGLTAADRLLAVTTLSFDIAGLELFLPWTTGARVEIAERGETLAGDELAARLSAAGITVMQATPATWRLLADAGWRGETLKVLCGGEALPRDLAQRLLAAAGELWNVYGPTETTIWSTRDRVAAATAAIPIGRPLDNTEVYVLDTALGPVPLAVPGELYLGGLGLARGYLGRPGRTAAAFVPHPFARQPGGRLYRTGDLARFLADGRLEFLGRLDHQVKVRGFRIELGEIEAVLAAHPRVAEAVALARDDRDAGDRLLVAYLVPAAGAAPAAEELRAWLRRSLPDYMIPAFFVPLAALPLTPNGKVDRKALPAPERRRREESAFVAPRNPVEEQIAALWREVLGVARIGVDDRFFDLGGHSLLATQVMTRLGRDLGVDLPLRAIFDRPTVAGLAELAVEQGITDADQEQLTRLLAELEDLSEEELGALLAAGDSPNRDGDSR